mmetsp:Transcript_40116/g.87597  ORF Transcript_40116/g.87597 Transcript_40116/m.87597 type:complete len:424 (+) Transcript_40116:65-1336(+)
MKERSSKSEAAVAEPEPETLPTEGGKKKKRRREDEEELASAPPAESVLPVDGKKRSKKQRMEEAPVDEPVAKPLETRKKSKKTSEIVEMAAEAAEADAAGTLVAAIPVDWAARKAEKKRQKLERAQALEERGKEDAKKKLEKKLAKEVQNAALREKGTLTKKQRYLAAKAAKKAEAQTQKHGVDETDGPFKLGRSRLEEEALNAAGMQKLDPRAVECFVTGLPYMATEQHIIEHFKDVGRCTVKLMRDPSTGKSNGRGFLTFATADQALRACTFTGSKIQNRWVKVRLCEVRNTGPSRTMQEEGAGEKPEGCLTAVIKCDRTISEASLWKFFEDCQIAGVSCMTDKETGEFRGTAFLDFEDTGMVDKAVKKSGLTIKGHPIVLRYKQERRVTDNRSVAPHNRAPPVPPPAGKITTFNSDSDDE